MLKNLIRRRSAVKITAIFYAVIFFLGQLLGVIDPDIKNRSEGIYNYCPSVFELEDGTRYIYYCTNINSYEIVDHIACRKGTRRLDGRYSWSEETIVLSPTSDSWDGHHTCDPSVVSGEFGYNGQSYKYLMAYLGCTSYDSQDNKIGLAVSNDPMGEFVKVGEAPFVDYEHNYDIDPAIFQWGVGQPSLVNMDCKSKIRMFYTRGDMHGTRMQFADFDAKNLSAPAELEQRTVTNRGLVKLNGSADYLNNGDFAYSAGEERFYAASDCHPYPATVPTGISDAFRITAIGENELESGVWNNIKEIGEEQTHFPRNHDTGLLRNEYGHCLKSNCFSVFYTIAYENEEWLWSFRIFEHRVYGE